MYEIKIQGLVIPYDIRASKRAKRITLKINPKDGLVVVKPHRLVVDVDALLQSKQTWILAHYQHIQQSAVIKRYETGDTIDLLGEKYPIERLTGSKERMALRNGKIYLQSSSHNPEKIKSLVGKWYTKQAKGYIIPRVHELAGAYGFTVREIRIRDQQSRWGSASSKGNLNFNRRLMMCPADVIDYVIIHELCHFHEMNHSRQFWQWVERFCPDYREHRAWLKLNGSKIQL